jgi:putative Holliday junction resolvase
LEEIKNKRILALDYGTKTVGVAVCDEMHITITPLNVIRRNKPTKLRQTLSRISELIDEYQPALVVLGFPYNLDGTEGFRCEDTLSFKEQLENRIKVPIVLYDERLSTVEAYEIMDEQGIDKLTQREVVDSYAAEVILRSYLNSIFLNKED